MIQTANIRLYRGDTHIVRLDLTANGEPVDLSGAVLALDILPSSGGSPIRPQITVKDNVVVLYFSSALTRDLMWERGVFDLRAVYGNIVKTYLRGTVLLVPSITPVADLMTDGDKPPVEEQILVDVSGQAVLILSDGSGGLPGSNGLSAYEIAQRNGFSGSEVEWLASLKGERGAQGIIGPAGQNGVDGKDGKPGADGARGFDGSDGLSAYEIAQRNGFSGSEAEWLASLKGEQGYAEYQEGYISRANFAKVPENSALFRVKFPQPFSRKPDYFSAMLDITDPAIRAQYINNVNSDGFDIATNYALSLQGVWYRAYIR